MSIINNAIRAKGEATMDCTLTLIFNDGSQKIKYVKEGEIINDLVYVDEYDTVQTITAAKVKVIAFSSSTSESESLNTTDLTKSKSVFSKVVKPVSILVDGSDICASNLVNIPLSSIVNLKADKIVNEKYQGTVYSAATDAELTEALASAATGDTILLAGGTYTTPLDLNKGVRFTAKKDENNNYEEVAISAPIVVTATEGTVEVDHITFKDITSAEGTGAGKATAKGNGIDITGIANVNFHDNEFKNFNNFYNIIGFATGSDVTITDNTFSEGLNYHVIEAGVHTPVGKVLIANNTFNKVYTHNTISFYEYAENAEITIKDNVFEYSANALRLSDTNAGKVVVNIEGNIYLSTDESSTGGDPRCTSTIWGGFAILQDYTGDQDFSNITMVFKNNFYTPDSGERLLVSANSYNTGAQAYYVYVNEATYTITHPIVKFANK